MDRNEVIKMTGKNPDRHWKWADYKISGLEIKRLEIEQDELLKTFDGHLADVKSQLAQKKTISAERAYKFSSKLTMNSRQTESSRGCY